MGLGVVKKAAVGRHKMLAAANDLGCRLCRVDYGIPVAALVVDHLGIALRMRRKLGKRRDKLIIFAVSNLPEC